MENISVVDELNRELLESQNMLNQARELELQAHHLQNQAIKERFRVWETKIETIQKEISFCLERIQLLQEKQDIFLVRDEQNVHVTFPVSQSDITLEQCELQLEELTNRVLVLYEKLQQICGSFGHVFQFEQEEEVLVTEYLEPSMEPRDQYRCLCCGRLIHLDRSDYPFSIGFGSTMNVRGVSFTFSEEQGNPLTSNQVAKLKQIRSLSNWRPYQKGTRVLKDLRSELYVQSRNHYLEQEDNITRR